jgi:hypothetical protein
MIFRIYALWWVFRLAIFPRFEIHLGYTWDTLLPDPPPGRRFILHPVAPRLTVEAAGDPDTSQVTETEVQGVRVRRLGETP